MNFQHSIHATFSEQAARMLDEIALVGDDQPVTYGELERRSDCIARHLRQHHVSRGDRVGLYSPRSADAIAAMLGILKAGACYVPFDPSYPTKLLQFVYEDCAPSLMLVEASLVATCPAPFWRGGVHDIRTSIESGASLPPEDGFQAAGGDDPAYIMYTSGSTGHPKGVLIPHRGVIRLVVGNWFAAVGPTQVHLQLAPLAFDASTFEIWGALLNGGKLAIMSAPYPSLDDVADNVSRHGVTTLWLTAGLFHLMVDHRLEGLLPLRQLLAGGDVLSPTHVQKAQAALPECQFINGYGPTENTTFTCCYRIPRDAAPGPIPIGTPIAQTQVYVMDDAREVPDGEEGELLTGGAGLALGYWNRPELTAERFIPDPKDPTGRARLYRTGDRVRRRADGNIEFLGRIDRQVKINGKRVELDEIEACIRRAPAVEDAAVICPAGEPGNRRVHAFVKFRAADGAGPEDMPPAESTENVRRFLKEELPDYMLPATFTVMQALPLSPTGKLDRAKLRPPQTVTASAPTEEVAGNEMEATLSTLWQKILGASPGLDDNFFDLGGTSLQLIAVHATIVASMRSDITVVELFQYPTIRALADRLRRVAGASPPLHRGETQKAADGTALNAEERARRQQAALARARTNPRRNVR